jgi:hypothetical protein
MSGYVSRRFLTTIKANSRSSTRHAICVGQSRYRASRTIVEQVMINMKAIGAGFALVLTSISAAQEAPTHHAIGTVNSGAGTRRSGPDGAGSSAGASQDPANTAGSNSFESHPGDGRYDDADTGFGPYGDTGGIFAGAERGHAGGSHGRGIFSGGPFFGGSAGGAGGSSGQGSGGSGSQGGGSAPDHTSGEPSTDPGLTVANTDSPSGDGNPPPLHFYEPPPFDFQPPPPGDIPQPPGKDTPPSGDVPRATPVAEPFTLSLFGAGLAGAAALRRRRTKKA